MRTIFLLALAMSFSLPAQEKVTPKQDRRQNIKVEVNRLRDQMRAGEIYRFNVRVTVRLKNGNRFKGVVKDGRFVEKHDGLDFVRAKDKNERTGLRLWYYNGTRSFIFLSYDDVAHYKIGDRLSDAQVLAIEKRLETKEKNAQQQRPFGSRQVLGGSNPNGSNPMGQQSNAGSKNVPTLTLVQKKLLTDYPPAQGWGEKKIKDLQMRRITLRVYPDAKEKAFEENYQSWKTAVAVQQAIEEAKQSAKQEAQGEPAKQSKPPVPTPFPPAPMPGLGR